MEKLNIPILLPSKYHLLKNWLRFLSFIYLFLVVLGVCCCARAFFSRHAQGSHFSGSFCFREQPLTMRLLFSFSSQASEPDESGCGTWVHRSVTCGTFPGQGERANVSCHQRVDFHPLYKQEVPNCHLL